MKKSINLIFASVMFAFFVSCSKDDSPTKATNTEQPQEVTEDKPVELSVLETEVKIGTLTQKKGMPPVPVGNVDFKINTSKQEGYQKNGFNIKFSSTSDVKGAYILFQDVNGNKSKSYFDVPKTSFGNKSTKTRMIAKSSQENPVETSGEQVIDVDFTDNFPPGEFCYEICLYDANNNVSAIEKICVKVEAWGGNSNLLGDWELDRFVSEDDDMTNVYCTSGDSIKVKWNKTIKEDIYFNVKADGSYEVASHNIEEELDYEASSKGCKAVYFPQTEEKTKSIGKWAYNEGNKTITLVGFQHIDELDDKNNETHPKGELMLDKAKVEFKNNELHITTDEGTEDEETAVFIKK